MPEFDAMSAVVPLVCLCGFALLLLVVALRISGRLGRIERLLDKQAQGGQGAAASERGRSSRGHGRDFERFLAEDPARRELPKSEQFAAYRQWRKEHGLSWGS